MQLLPRQSLARLQHFLTVKRQFPATHHSCAARCQASVQQLRPTAAAVTGSAAPLCGTGLQSCTQRFSNHLPPPADVSRFHTTRHVAARSTANATGETDSVAAVKRLVSLHVRVTRVFTQWQPTRQAWSIAQGHLSHTFPHSKDNSTLCAAPSGLHTMAGMPVCWPECNAAATCDNLAASECMALQSHLRDLFACSMMQQSSVYARLCS